MAREKEFDQDQALDAAMNLFWERGYAATSIQDVVEATGVQRQSLYNTFGSKHGMFLQTLIRYQELEGEQLTAMKKNHLRGGLPLIRAMFENCAAQTIGDGRGCFAANCAVELANSDESVAQRIQMGRDGLEKLFERCLAQARGDKQLGTSSPIPALSHFLVNAYFGLRLMAKTKPTKAMIDNVVKITLGALQ